MGSAYHIKEKIGSITDFVIGERAIDIVAIEWFETSKRILQKRTNNGLVLHMRFLNENPNLMKDDVLFEDERNIIVIDILPCEVIAVQTGSIAKTATLCYEIGNKHLPLFYEEDFFLIPYDEPLFRLLSKAGFEPKKQKRKLLHPIRTSVAAHAHGTGGKSLFEKIMDITNPIKNGE